ncbi:M48 family metallopeptidase [Photobacterium piscicola]|uniref:M48 family metallopeptidase n=1 Tax=Photobacterium piscicola TaxID=1378299 RepID=UPI0038D004E1
MATDKAVLEQITANGYVVNIIRTKRTKTVTINVIEGVVSITVPKALDLSRIVQVVESKHTWIIEKLAIHKQAAPKRDKEFVSGEAFSYLGRNYRLKVNHGDYQSIRLIQGRLAITLPDDINHSIYARKGLIAWYKRQAEKKIREKVERYAGIVGVETGVIRIKSFKSRWGSCTPYGDVEFNWVIMMAPNRVVDYVVIHELCHLIQMDHSPQFWREVERVMPDYLEHKEWLKTNGYKLVI